MYEYHGNKGSRRQQEIKKPLTLYRAGGFLFISCRRYQTDHLQIYSGGVRILNVQLEASAIQAKGLAEAEAMEKKAEAYAKYNKAAVAEMMIKVLPEVAGKIAEPLAQIDKITIIGGADGGNGVDQVAGNVPVVMAKLFESMKEATGIDLADIVNADSYDAKVNRNVNLTGLDNVNLVVSDNKEQKPEA